MGLQVRTEVHYYSREELCDGDLELRKLGRGLYSEPFNAQLMKFHDKTIEVEVTDQLTLGGFQNIVLSTVWKDYLGDSKEGEVEFYFLTSGNRYAIDNPAAPLYPALEKYLDSDSTGRIAVGLYVCEEAGHFKTEGKLRFSFRSGENGSDNEPHVHVSVIGQCYDEEPFSVLDGRPLLKEPKMRVKYQNMTTDVILKNHAEFLEGWNAKTIGLKVDVNKQLGLIKY